MKFLAFVPQNHDMDMDRIDRLRNHMQNRKASICSERALFYTRSFQETEGKPYIIRKAEAFAYTLRHMTIYIEPDSLIFGNQASRDFAAPVFPEYSIDWVVEELEQFDKRNGDVFTCSEKVKQDIRSIVPYWHGHTHEDEVKRHTTERIASAEKQKVIHRGGISMSGDGHIVPDYDMVLKRGLRDIQKEAEQYLNNPDLTEENRNFYEAVSVSLNGVLDYIKRYSPLAFEMSQKETDPKRKEELLKISDMASRLMEHPAQSYYEGVETVYLIHVLEMIESNGHSFCYGRFDQYMYDLYKHDIEAGVLTKEKALEITTHMFLMNSTQNKVRPYGHTKFSQGYPLYSNLMIGGYKPDGTDGSNELSYLCIEAMNLTAMAEPNFSMRYNRDTPKSLLKLAAQLIRTGCGMPSMFNDDIAAKGIEDLGIRHEDALDYCAIGCVETGVPGKYGHRATGMTYVNWGKILELILNNGTDPVTGIQMISVNGKKGSTVHFHSYEELWNAWKKFLKFYSDIAVESDEICDKSLAVYDADPFASSLIHNSMKLGKTLKNGGCQYDVISQSNIGPTVLGNSLMAVKKLVFDDHVITYEELMDAIHHNWKGEEGERIRNLCLSVPKFGNDNDEVDQIVSDVYESYLDLLPSYHTLREGKGPEVSCYTMSTSNITSYVPNGMDVGATPDGREAGSPLNEGCSPVQGTDVMGPTAVIHSVSKLPNERVAAGQLLNMRFSPASLQGDENLDKFCAFLRGSQRLGIYHNQFNVIDSKTLRKAQETPDQYRSLIVRVAGYCAQFVSLMPETQNAIIARTENRL